METKRRKPLLICSIATATVVAIAILVAITLAFTVFKPRDPTVKIYLVGLRKLGADDLLSGRNVTTDMVIGISNQNYAGFKFANATSLVTYSDDLVVGEVPVPGGEIRARSDVNVTTSAVLIPAKLMKSKAALEEALETNALKLKAAVMLYGTSSFCGVKVKTSVYTECHLTVVLGKVPRGESWCWSKLKIN
ncbi:unnamed protein product [Linum tenue]|uniref:Late embryogenesis abundant protein LEA-2 subgroup domain-containing protein n=1 Tax=Linum tenue TaxID=586396 RepID=A0AAV0R8U6_9ROSI|nr:unnamed protein product [Linum tenue]